MSASSWYRINVSRHDKVSLVGIALRLRQRNRLPIFWIVRPCFRHFVGPSFHSRWKIGASVNRFERRLYSEITYCLRRPIFAFHGTDRFIGCGCEGCRRRLGRSCRRASAPSAASARTYGRTASASIASAVSSFSGIPGVCVARLRIVIATTVACAGIFVAESTAEAISSDSQFSAFLTLVA